MPVSRERLLSAVSSYVAVVDAQARVVVASAGLEQLLGLSLRGVALHEVFGAVEVPAASGVVGVHYGGRTGQLHFEGTSDEPERVCWLEQTEQPRAGFSALRATYRASFTGKLAVLRAALGSAAASPSAHDLAHRIHGSAGTYGFAQVSEAAAALELQLAQGAPDEVVQAAFAALEHAMRSASSEGT